MKSDSERQAAYQKRRVKTETRIVLWLSKDLERLIGVLRGSQTRSDWVRRAIVEAAYRQLAGLPLSSLMSDDELALAQKRAGEHGTPLRDGRRGKD